MAYVSSALLASLLQGLPLPADWDGLKILHIALAQCPLELTELYSAYFILCVI